MGAPSGTAEFTATGESFCRYGIFMDLDLRRARYFQAVAQELHFGRAAHRLHVAQPALSRQIAALERELGVILLERSTQRVSLTAAGTVFLDDIGAVIVAADDAIRRVRQGERGASALTIGFMPGLSLHHAMRTVMDEHPEAVIEIRELTWVNQADLVRDGTVDVALVRRPIDATGLRLQRVIADPRGVLLASDHPLANEAAITIAELADLPVIRHRHGGAWDDYWMVSPRPDGRVPIAGPMVETIPEKLAVVAGGAAITFVPRSASRAYTHPDVVWVPISDIDDSQVALAWVAGRRSRILSAFAAAVAQAPAEVIGASGYSGGVAGRPWVTEVA